ncbi:MAG: hypothetical protein V9F05_05355 [Chitinophagaceae bacterium]
MIETETPHSAFSAEAELEWKARADFAGVQKSSCSKKETVFIGLHPAFLSAKNPIFAFIRNNAQSGISKYSSRSQ